MLRLNIHIPPGNISGTLLLQCLKGRIKVDSALGPFWIAWQVQHIMKEGYDTEQANDEIQDSQAKNMTWGKFLRRYRLLRLHQFTRALELLQLNLFMTMPYLQLCPSRKLRAVALPLAIKGLPQPMNAEPVLALPSQ